MGCITWLLLIAGFVFVVTSLIRCAQFPTTLPTLDEMIGIEGITEENVAARVLEATRTPRAADHVFTLHAELEGMRLAPVLDELIAGWKAQGWGLGPVRAQYDAVEPMALPRCEVAPNTILGRTGTLLMQGAEFLAGADVAQAPGRDVRFEEK